MALNLGRLATFVMLAEQRNFSRTAEALHLSQPAVTQQVRALERELGVRLVDVVARRTEITDLGTLVAERAALLLREAEALEREVREVAGVRRGVLRVGATVTIGGSVLPQLLAAFGARFPDVHNEVTIANTGAIVPMVARGLLALALVEGDVPPAGLEVVPFQRDELVVLASPAHPLARRRAVAAAELAAEPFVSREPGSGTRELFLRHFRAAGVEPRIVVSLSASDAIVRAVECGLGLAVVSPEVARDALARGTVVRLPLRGPRIRRAFTLVRRALVTPAPAAAAFAALVLERRRDGATSPSGRRDRR